MSLLRGLAKVADRNLSDQRRLPFVKNKQLVALTNRLLYDMYSTIGFNVQALCILPK
jgi:hypothetical protein